MRFLQGCKEIRALKYSHYQYINMLFSHSGQVVQCSSVTCAGGLPQLDSEYTEHVLYHQRSSLWIHVSTSESATHKMMSWPASEMCN